MNNCETWALAGKLLCLCAGIGFFACITSCMIKICDIHDKIFEKEKK